jgi:D-alanyl-lipoteichoic acid acyltransferase DltB (MBOAT superfamily)
LDGFHFLRILFDREFAGGLYSWRLPANFLVLRIISYNMDVYWAHRGIDSNRDVDNKDKEQEGFTEEYDSLANYFAYILYAPLYIAGPIVTYKAFLKGKTSSESVPIYFMRWLLCLAVMEYLTHRFPFFAVISSGLLPRLTVAETAVLFYLILKMAWRLFAGQSIEKDVRSDDDDVLMADDYSDNSATINSNANNDKNDKNKKKNQI